MSITMSCTTVYEQVECSLKLWTNNDDTSYRLPSPLTQSWVSVTGTPKYRNLWKWILNGHR
jgi:hypothetical protein